MKFINKGTIIAALVGGITAIALTTAGVALAYGGARRPSRQRRALVARERWKSTSPK